MDNVRVPNINDLRVKLCYICRDEEYYDRPEDPPRVWTHPCKCTLVAHESCLLRWIQTSQGDASRADHALKCPQCGTQYELESNRPFILRLLGSGNKILQKMGRAFTLFSAVGCLIVFASGVYVVCTAYGVWAVEKFIGKEMFDILLTDDPSNWPWNAYINLPILPLSLIASRFQSAAQIPSIIPLLLIWPIAAPVGLQNILDKAWRQPDSIDNLTSPLSHEKKWPPSPVLLGFFIVPFVRVIYRRLFARLQYWVLGVKPTPHRPTGPIQLQVNEGGPFMIRIRANVNMENQQGEQQQQQQQHAAQEGQEPAEQEPNAAAVAAAEQLIEIDTSSLGRRIGGALLIPAISSFMGSMLLRLSRTSAHLRSFLGVRPPLGQSIAPPLGSYSFDRTWQNMSLMKQLGLTIRLVMNVSWNGTRTWNEADPVWWRNSVGLGLFIVAKDCIQLLHLWLAKRELASRRVKSRDFAGVDVRELDLVPSFPRNE